MHRTALTPPPSPDLGVASMPVRQGIVLLRVALLQLRVMQDYNVNWVQKLRCR